MKRLLYLVVLMLFSTLSFAQNTYYINSSGSNSNDGSSANPWGTLTYAVSQVADGDVLMLSGTLTESNVLIDKDLTIVGESPATTILQAQATNPHDESPRNPLVNNRMLRTTKAGKTLTIRDLTLRYGNITTQGGAIYSSVASNIVIEGCNILDNYCGQHGGAISTKGSLTVNGSTIAGNVSYIHGGGVYMNANTQDITVSNSLIYNNTSMTQQGGALRVVSASLTLNNNTIAFNKCDLANKVEGVQYQFAGALTMTNNIFYNNTQADDNKAGGEDIGGLTPASVVSKNNIFSYVGNSVYYDDNSANTTASNNIINSANVTASLLNFGAYTQNADGLYTLPVLEGSIAVDAGDIATAESTDMHGTQRAVPDIGAYELEIEEEEVEEEGALYVANDGNNSNDGSLSSPFATVAYAVSQAENGGVVIVKGTVTENNITITKDITIKGTNPASSILQAQTSNPHDESPRNPLADNRMIKVTATGISLTLENLTLRYGNTTTQGGAIYATGVSDINIIGCNIMDCYSAQQGGAISTKGNLTIENSSVINNVGASHGGGVYVNGNTKDVNISNSLVYNNRSTGQQGGAMRIASATLTLNNNTIAFNKCDLDNKAEGINYNYSGVLTMTNNIFFNHIKANDNKAGGEDISGNTPTSVVSKNNIFSYVASNVYYDNANAVTTASGNLVNKDNVTEALIQFGGVFQAPEGLYVLPIFPSSIAVDAGDNSSSTTTDALGTPRTTADIGAYETGGSINIPPTFIASSDLEFPENNEGVIVKAVDDGTFTYSIVGGTDQSVFSINSNDGKLTFNTAPVIDSPTDANGDNVYEVEIQIVDDLGATDTQSFSVTVVPVQLNVLMIVLDDLNDYIGVMGGHPQAKTPNMDRLARNGVLFTNAHSNAPLCNPSRASFLNGILPSSSGLYGTKNWNQYPILKNSKTISEHMSDNGYTTYKTGKIAHSSSGETARWDYVLDKSQDYGPVAYNGSKGVTHPSAILELDEEGGSLDGTFGSLANIPNVEGGHNGWYLTTYNEPFHYVDDNNRDLMPDERSVNWIKEQLETLSDANSTAPFLMAAGLIRPHSPFVVPQKYFDMFPLETIQIPDMLLNDLDDSGSSLDGRGHMIFEAVQHSYLDKQEGIKRYLQSYLASVAFADDMVGQLLDALENSNYANNTAVILFSDHGYNMGEKNYAWKNNLWDNATRVPLIITSPLHTASAGSRVDQPVSLVDVYPTINDLCLLTGDTKKNEEGADLDGHSLVPFIEDGENGQWAGDEVAFSEVAEWFFETPSRQSYTLRSKRFRYISRYNEIAELYDHEYDTNEWINVIDEPAYTEVKSAMEAKLHSIVENGLILKDELEDFSNLSEYSDNLVLNTLSTGNVGGNDPTQMIRNAEGNASLVYEVSGLKKFSVEMWNTITNSVANDVGTIRAYVAGTDKVYNEVALNMISGNYTWERNLLTFSSAEAISSDVAYLKVELESDASVDFSSALLGSVTLYGEPTSSAITFIDDIVVDVDESIFEIAPENIRANTPMLPFLTDSLNNMSLIYESTGCTYISNASGESYGGDNGRLVRCSLESASITYEVDGLDHFRIEFWGIAGKQDWEIGTLKTYVAGDDKVFTEIASRPIDIEADYTALYAIVPTESLPEDVKYFKIELSAGTSEWNAQIGTVHLYNNRQTGNLRVGSSPIINSIEDIQKTPFKVAFNGIYLPDTNKYHIQILSLTGKVMLDKMGSGFEGFNFKKNQLYIIRVDEAVRKISFR